jgi:hypothetical protein
VAHDNYSALLLASVIAHNNDPARGSGGTGSSLSLGSGSQQIGSICHEPDSEAHVKQLCHCYPLHRCIPRVIYTLS